MTATLNTTEVASTFQKRPCYRYIRRTDKLPTSIHWETESADIAVRVRLFNPTGIGTWWIAAYDPETQIAFGAAELFEREVGDIWIPELVELRGLFGLPIERDLYFKPCSLADVMSGSGR